MQLWQHLCPPRCLTPLAWYFRPESPSSAHPHSSGIITHCRCLYISATGDRRPRCTSRTASGACSAGGSYAFYHLVRAFSYLEITESSTLEIVGVVGSSTPSEYLFGTFLLLTVGGLRVGEGSALRIENNTVSADQSPSYIYALCALVETQTSFTVLATVRTWSETTRSSWLTHPCPAISMRAW